MDIETELDQILAKLGMDPLGFRLSFRWLKEVILYAGEKAIWICLAKQRRTPMNLFARVFIKLFGNAGHPDLYISLASILDIPSKRSLNM